MNKVFIAFIFVFVAFTTIVEAQEISMNEFTGKLLDHVVFKSSDLEYIKKNSIKHNTINNNEVNVFFDKYNIIYEKNISEYSLKFAYFETLSILLITNTNIKNKDDVINVFGKPNLSPIDSGFETIGYMTTYINKNKDYNINIYFYFNINTKDLNFIRLSIKK